MLPPVRAGLVVAGKGAVGPLEGAVVGRLGPRHEAQDRVLLRQALQRVGEGVVLGVAGAQQPDVRDSRVGRGRGAAAGVGEVERRNDVGGAGDDQVVRGGIAGGVVAGKRGAPHPAGGERDIRFAAKAKFVGTGLVPLDGGAVEQHRLEVALGPALGVKGRSDGAAYGCVVAADGLPDVGERFVDVRVVDLREAEAVHAEGLDRLARRVAALPLKAYGSGPAEIAIFQPDVIRPPRHQPQRGPLRGKAGAGREVVKDLSERPAGGPD